MSVSRPAWVLLLGVPACLGQARLEEILAKLADGQERAVEARKSIVYRQDTWVRLLRTNGKLSREEKRQYTVAPSAKGFDKKLDRFEGRYERGGKLLTYEKPNHKYKDLDIDGDLIEDLTNDLVNDTKSRDGISKDLFPLTRNEQRHYIFKLDGARRIAGVEALRVTFEPKKVPDGDEDRVWAGEVLIHPEEFQPLLVSTRLALKIPVAVKVIFGIDIKQLGFNVTYRKVADGLWFPSTYGTEFGLKVLFGYKRNITMNVTNTDFRQTDAVSHITFEGPAEKRN
ncbi:MAG: hypothetical protein HY858_06995 [Candidatus Solibacter usitatus]|nr:hypothetical protein [Candidatus Solibacter usitatus]